MVDVINIPGVIVLWAMRAMIAPKDHVLLVECMQVLPLVRILIAMVSVVVVVNVIIKLVYVNVMWRMDSLD